MRRDQGQAVSDVITAQFLTLRLEPPGYLPFRVYLGAHKTQTITSS